MRYEWDERKRQTNLEKHGLDFIDGPLVLEAEEKAVFPARSEQEERFKAIASPRVIVNLVRQNCLSPYKE